jgi:fructuronate reductase
MNLSELKNTAAWAERAVALPRHDVQAMISKTKAAPRWVHFGTGNIFRGFIASLAQRILGDGSADSGIIAAETFDYDIIDSIFVPNDNLTMNVTLKADGGMDCEVIASIAEAIRVDTQIDRLKEIFAMPSLQMASFTITEKGYTVFDGNAMDIVTDMLYARYKAGAFPIAMVSMDNCSANGDRIKSCVLEFAARKNDPGFTAWLNDPSKVSFPWSMIDKITPRPAKAVEDLLSQKGIEGMAPIITSKKTFIAAFVNAERPQYLVIEDAFPNGRPALDKAGVIFTDRETVSKTERMKVTTCLNPLHTAMAVYGCLLGYDLICEEMKDADIVALIKRLGYIEGLPVVVDPGILSPKKFIDEVVSERLPNPFMPDAPQRIATDTSQKVGIRYGETVKSYIEGGRSLDALVSIPLAIAGWLRYLLAVDDKGAEMEVSADPMKDALQAKLSGVVWNDPSSYAGQLMTILTDAQIFGLDLTATPLAKRIEGYFVSMLGGVGAVRETLHREINA